MMPAGSTVCPIHCTPRSSRPGTSAGAMSGTSGNRCPIRPFLSVSGVNDRRNSANPRAVSRSHTSADRRIPQLQRLAGGGQVALQ